MKFPTYSYRCIMLISFGCFHIDTASSGEITSHICASFTRQELRTISEVKIKTSQDGFCWWCDILQTCRNGANMHECTESQLSNQKSRILELFRFEIKGWWLLKILSRIFNILHSRNMTTSHVFDERLHLHLFNRISFPPPLVSTKTEKKF